ncbi:helix-turn-helix domain-containing protein [Pseudomonas sp. FW300-N2A2]|uniref:helix-turn-helix domain-containing protein n=1 Tax=Pseudomonas sp. FW300-N2A2 TaxID=2751316 RepID=UPI001A9252AD|nr:helix-turn-helix domain-containing protein [Pseudomonas sp. FW300-N2A2]
MTAKLSPDSVGLIFTMHAAGHPVEHIADAAGCSYPTVVRYLNAAGIVLGNKGKPKQLTTEYLTMALDMRAAGSTWYDVEHHIGFHRSTFQSELRAMRTQSCS